MRLLSSSVITHAPLIRGGAAYVYESPFGDSCQVTYIHNPFLHCVMSQCVFKPRDVIMLSKSISVATRTPQRRHVESLQVSSFSNAMEQIANKKKHSPKFFSNTWRWNCGSRNYSKTWNAGCTYSTRCTSLTFTPFDTSSVLVFFFV